MAVYTKISQEQLINHLRNYDIDELVEFQEILDGIDNSNFILKTNFKKFVFTIFESRIDKASLPFFINLKLHLAKKGIPCPRPIISRSGDVILEFKEKKSVIVSFVSGKTLISNNKGYYPGIVEKHCFQIGKLLANLHNAASDFASYRKNDLGICGFKPLFKKFSQLIDYESSSKKSLSKDSPDSLAIFNSDLGLEIYKIITWVENNWQSDLPSAATHLDLFPDNVFFNENADLSGVIDFYFAANDALIYDFAIAVNAWCFEPGPEFQGSIMPDFNEKKFQAMLAGYESIREFSSAEKNFLKIALIAAATRFLLTRLHDFFFTTRNSLVRVKDPSEYLHKLRFFRDS